MGCLGLSCFSGGGRGGGSDDEDYGGRSRRKANLVGRQHYDEVVSDDDIVAARSSHNWGSRRELDASSSPEQEEYQGARISQRWDSAEDLNHDSQTQDHDSMMQQFNQLRIQPRTSFSRNRDMFDRHENTPSLRSDAFDRPRPSLTYTDDPRNDIAPRLSFRIGPEDAQIIERSMKPQQHRRRRRAANSRKDQTQHGHVEHSQGSSSSLNLERGEDYSHIPTTSGSRRHHELNIQRQQRQANSERAQNFERNHEVQFHQQGPGTNRRSSRPPKPSQNLGYQ